jgi:hypothetical protein
MKIKNKKIIVLLLAILLIFPVQFTYAQTPQTTTVNQQQLLPINLQQSQAASSLYGSYGGSASADLSGAGGSALQCAGIGTMSNSIKKSIQSLLGGSTSSEVPVSDGQQRAKDSGTSFLGLSTPSWDQVGWCLVNSIIETISKATVQWINSGFQGNPAFIEDPGQFFGDVADIQAVSFLNEVTGGALCTPIRDWLRIDLAQNYNNRFNPYGQQQCSFENNALTQFTSGETFSWNDWLNYSQNSDSNRFGASTYGQIALNNRITSALGMQQQQLQWNAGFLSKKDPETGKVTSPGSVIQEQLNERLFSGQRRLEISDEFDEVVSALVNQLIKIAITEMTE